MSTNRSFKEYIAETDQIQESSWLSKGFAVLQYSRHEQQRQKLVSLGAKIKGLAHKGEMESDPEHRQQFLFQTLELLGDGFVIVAELSKSNIAVSVASNLLEENIQKAVERALATKK